MSSKVFTLLKNEKKTKADLAKYLGVTNQHVNNWVARGIPRKYHAEIAKFLNTTIDYLFSDDSSDANPVKKVPIIGTASCGMPTVDVIQDDGYCYYNSEYFTDKLYCVIAYGDSMAPEIDDGDEVVCDPDITLQNGDMVHYTLHGEGAIKVFVKDDEANIIQFIPYNAHDDFKTKTIRLDDETAVQSLVMAKVITVHKKKFNNRAARLKLVGRG